MADSERKYVMKNFSFDEEELLKKFLFTNPWGNEGFIYPQELVAGEEASPLASAVSRTHISTQDRILEFLDKEKTEQTRQMMEHIPVLMGIFRHPDGTLKVSKRTENFSKEYVLTQGHASIKEETQLSGHIEDISDVAIKLITGHPLNKPQVKSTRYISFGQKLDLSLQDPDIASLPDAEKYFEHIAYLNRRYLEVTERLADIVFGHSSTPRVVAFLGQPHKIEEEVEKYMAKKRKYDPEFNLSLEERERERQKVLRSLEDKGVRREIGKAVLDHSRVYLPAVTRTSGVFSIDARTLEDILTSMISSPRIEDRERGEALWRQARIIAPVLLGQKSHVKVDRWRLNNETKLRDWMVERFGSVQALLDERTATLITPQDMNMYTDRFNAALVAFRYLDAPLEDIYAGLSERDVVDILEKAHEDRGPYDILHPAISHGGLIVEFLMAYHGYRDIFRHRRGSRTTQLLTTRHGLEIPESFTYFGLDQEYLKDMQKSAQVYEQARKVSAHIAEKLVPFGAKIRAIHSWQPDQIAYVGELRTDIEECNYSYVNAIREVMRQFSALMPETAKYLVWDEREYPPWLVWKKGFGWYDETQRDKSS